MIFVTVGSQQSFDRLIRAVDAWAEESGQQDIFAQIADGQYEPRHMEFCRFLDVTEFNERVEQADLVVAHAGMGIIITALRLNKPLLTLPRRGSLRETRNDHQYATARHLSSAGKLHVAMDESELAQKLDQLEEIQPVGGIGNMASQDLMEAVRGFVEEA